MAYTYDLNPTHGLVLLRNASSKWTGRDVLQSADDVIDDDRFAADYDWVYDLRFAHSVVITVVELEQIVERFRLYRDDDLVAGESRSVIVGEDDDLKYAGRLYQQKAGLPDHRFAAVDTLEAARRWLGLEGTTASLDPVG